MGITPVALQRLALNPHNDRHGPLKDEGTAIQWLLDHRGGHMRALAEDLAKSRRLYEQPLIRPDGSDFVVFDGNRRVCCIKLLANPKLAPSENWVEYFSDLASDDLTRAFAEVECEIESDLEIIDEKLFRRHTGSQDGIGRSQWDPEAKSFFLLRTGKESIGLGESIERVLKTENLIPADQSLPWSNLERLLSSEPIRKRVGVSFAGGSLTYLTDKKKNLEPLQRIAMDMRSQRIVLDDVWNNVKKGQYLDHLKSEGFSIDRSSGAKTVASFEGGTPVHIAAPERKGRAPKDKHLISRADQNPFMPFPELERAEKIWRELQFHLEFEDHENAIAVLMRVLLELAILNYADRHGFVFGSADTFARRVSAVSDSMLNRGLIDKKGRSIIKKFESDKPIVSAHSMHQYVHNPNFHPARSDMKAIWNVVRVIIINSVR